MVSCMCFKVLYMQYHIYRCRVQGVLAYTRGHTCHRLYTVSCIYRKRPTERDQKKETYKCEKRPLHGIYLISCKPEIGDFRQESIWQKRLTQSDVHKETYKKRPILVKRDLHT